MQHLDEGTIHTWLDGALGPNEASGAEAHVLSCAQCAQAVAEARGLIAASSRILGALDDVATVQESAREPLRMPSARSRSGWWWRRAGMGYAAAATALLAVGTTMVLRSASPDAAMEQAASPVAASAPRLEPETSRALRDGAPSAPQAASRVSRDASDEERGSAARAKLSASEPQAKKDELVVDKIVPLPGPPPSVIQDERKAAVADLAAKVAPTLARGALVQGRVLDAATGAPVVGATVSVDSTRAQTDSAGKFELQSVPSGQQTVRVRALGFQSAQHQLAITRSDSLELGFALQKSALELQNVVVTGAAEQAQGARRDSIALPKAAAQRRSLADLRANAESVRGCYLLRAVTGKERDADRSGIESLPSRVQLDAALTERAANEALMNRARTLEGNARVESWRFVGDSLEVAWLAGARRRVLRFARRDTRWVSDAVVMEPCPTR